MINTCNNLTSARTYTPWATYGQMRLVLGHNLRSDKTCACTLLIHRSNVSFVCLGRSVDRGARRADAPNDKNKRALSSYP